MNLESRIRELLLTNDFFKIENLLREASIKDLDESLSKIAFENKSIVIYSLVCMMLMKKEAAELHYVAALLLMNPLCYIEGAYFAALYHIRKAICLDPEDMGLKEVLIFLHEVPDKVVSKEEAILVANQLLEKEPNNKCAKYLLKRYGI